jgi:hypothetical protein
LFREHLNVPLAAVELSFNGEFFLQDGDADLLLRVEGRDLLWQKECLLNLLVHELPSECDMVAWIDCDVIFEDKDWSSKAVEALKAYKLIHLFDHRVDSSPTQTEGGNFTFPSEKDKKANARSIGYQWSTGKAIDADFFIPDSISYTRIIMGLAWASPRDILEKHGLYDACILGGADRTIVCSAIGRFDLGAKAIHMTDASINHYLQWAKPYFESAQSSFGHIPGRILHLWHGEMKDRKYDSRHNILIKHGFDPLTDVIKNDQGLWQWSSAKPELHAEIAAYFRSRKEDG